MGTHDAGSETLRTAVAIAVDGGIVAAAVATAFFLREGTSSGLTWMLGWMVPVAILVSIAVLAASGRYRMGSPPHAGRIVLGTLCAAAASAGALAMALTAGVTLHATAPFPRSVTLLQAAISALPLAAIPFLRSPPIPHSIEGPTALGLRITPFRRIVFFAGVDALLVTASVLVALALRFDGTVPPTVLGTAPLVLALAASAQIVALAILGIYEASWAFIGLRDVARIALASAATAVIIGSGIHIGQTSGVLGQFPRSIAFIQAPITFCAIAGFRLSKRALRVALGERRSVAGTRTLLVGGGDGAAQVIRSIEATGAPYRVVGILDDDPLAAGIAVLGVRVLGPVAQLGMHVRATRAETVIVSLPTATSPLVQRVVRDSREAGARNVRIVPPLQELYGGRLSIEATREVSIDDLLGREAIAIDTHHVGQLIARRHVVVTGGAGTIGSELCRQILRFAPRRLTIIDIDESRLHDLAGELRETTGSDIQEALLDIRDGEGVRRLFESTRPDVVFHAAAYKHVPMMERHPLSSLETNVLGTANVVDAAEVSGVGRFVLISTDKAVEPSSIMGASKRLAELVVLGPSHPRGMKRAAVRFGNVLGSRGSVVPTFERQLKHGGPLTVTHPDITRFFMMTSEAVSLVLQAAALGEAGDLFILDMGRPVRILDVAKEFIRLHGMVPDQDIQIKITGLRPGEKLTESLVYPEEVVAPTTHARILRVAATGVATPTDLVTEVRALVTLREPEAALAFFHERFPSLREFAPAPSGIAGREDLAPSATN